MVWLIIVSPKTPANVSTFWRGYFKTLKLTNMEKKILYIDREAFVDWYFDWDTCKDFVGTYSVTSELKTEGTFSISVEDLLSGCGYLPGNLAMENQDVKLDDQDEIDMGYYDEIKFYDFEASKKL